MRTWRTSEVGPGSRLYAWLVVKLRWVVVVGWLAIIGAAAVWLPGTTPNADLGGFAPPNSRAIATETSSAKAFGFPLLSRTVLVQHDARGLSPEAQRRVVERSVAVAQRKAGDVTSANAERLHVVRHLVRRSARRVPPEPSDPR